MDYIFLLNPDPLVQIEVDGKLTITITPGEGATGKADIVGNLTFSGNGAPITSVDLDITVDFDLADMTFDVSGKLTIDGVEYDASALSNEDVIFLIMMAFMPET